MFNRLIVAALTLLFFTLFSASAKSAKNCSVDNSAGLTPSNQQSIVDSGFIAPGQVLTAVGESNTSQIFAQVKNSQIVLHNAAAGGCAIGSLARNVSKCWKNARSDTDVILMKPVNRSKGIDPAVYMTNLEADARKAIQLLPDKLKDLSQVWLVAHHATPWSSPNNRGVPPKQGEPYSWWSGPVMANIRNNPPLTTDGKPLPFEVLFTTDLWANGSVPRSDGLIWNCSDFSSDGVHLSDGSNIGNDKAANEIEKTIANAFGSAPPPDPDPDPDPDPAPDSCLDRVSNNDPLCRINWKGVCQCR